MGLIGPEVADPKALGIPLDQAEILVTNKEVVGRTLEILPRARRSPASFRSARSSAAACRSGRSQDRSCSEWTSFRLSASSLRSTTSLRCGAGSPAPTTATDLLTLSAGMILGFLIGMIQFPAFGASIGLGNAGGLLLSGVIVSSVVSRLRFFGNTPNAARNVLEDLGLVVFVAIVGVNAGAGLLAQLTGAIALKIFIVGFIACTIPPFIVWAIGYHVFKINPAVLMGGVAGARSHSGPCREAAVEIQSTGALDRVPGRLRGLGNPAHRVRILRDAAGAVGGSADLARAVMARVERMSSSKTRL